MNISLECWRKHCSGSRYIHNKLHGITYENSVILRITDVKTWIHNECLLPTFKWFSFVRRCSGIIKVNKEYNCLVICDATYILQDSSQTFGGIFSLQYQRSLRLRNIKYYSCQIMLWDSCEQDLLLHYFPFVSAMD
jgi:hypothetical protein